MNLRLLAFISFNLASRVFAESAAPASAAATNETIIFVGNSFMFGAGSAARYYRANTVTDLNGEAQGGVPALFKVFANQAGLNFTVSLETVGGAGLDLHVEKKAAVIGRPWDRVVMLGQSMLDNLKPGDTTKLAVAAKDISALFSRYNPRSPKSRVRRTHRHQRPPDPEGVQAREAAAVVET